MKVPMKWLREYTHIALDAQDYAQKMVMRLCMEAYLQGRTPVLECGSLPLEDFYTRLGFQTVAYWGRRLLVGQVAPGAEQK